MKGLLFFIIYLKLAWDTEQNVLQYNQNSIHSDFNSKNQFLTNCLVPCLHSKQFIFFTKTHRICVFWRNQYNEEHEHRFNVGNKNCGRNNNSLYCIEQSGDKYNLLTYTEDCEIKFCNTVKTVPKCLAPMNVIATSSSIIINVSFLCERCIIVLLSEQKSCFIKIQCFDECGIMKLYKIIHFEYCTVLPGSYEKTNILTLSPLNETTFYDIYIIRLHYNSVSMTQITIKTLTNIQNSVRNIKTTHKTTSSLSFSWDKLKESDNNGLPDYYEASLNETLPKKKCYNESVEFLDLRMCTEYCLRVYSRNKAGESRNSESSCHYTLAPNLGHVKVNDIKSGPSSQRVISWTYSSNDHCGKSYKVKYKDKFKEDDMVDYHIYEDTKNNKIMIKNLEKNNIYVVQVRPETNLETKNNKKYGEYSKEVEFYTGEVNPSIYEYKEEVHPSRQQMNISWRVHASYEGSIFQFIVVIKNSSKECLKSINLICSTCPHHYKLTNLNTEVQKKRRDLLHCKKKTERKYFAKDLNINYNFSFEEPLKNFSVEIFAINLIGVHKVHDHNSFYNEKQSNNIGTTTLCLLLLTIIIIVAALIYKFKKFSGFKNKKSRKKSNRIIKGNNARLKEINSAVERNETWKLSLVANKSVSLLEETSSNVGVALNEFDEYFNKMKENDNKLIIQEYKKLNLQSKKMERNLSLSVEIGKSSENANKNRFVNILPFDQTRVILEGRSAKNDYINANYIPFISQEDKHEYIASQGPIEHSINDFWQMISTQNINCIVMLTRTMEEGKFKCLQYWPEKIGEQISFGDKWKITVKLLEETESESHFERLLIMTNEKSMEERRIVHLHMHTWFDFSAPNLDYFNNLLFRFQDVANNTATNPYLVHCSAGVGRTGTLICIDRIIKQLKEGCQEINIYDTVFTLRHSRNLLVQRQAQYVFIHEYINYFLKKYMKTDDGEEMLYFNEN